MRRLLGVLRSDSAEPELAPQPGLADIAALVRTARDAGAQVALQQEGELADVPAGVGLTGYRVIQEALANAGRHAPGAPVHVGVRGSATALRIVVSNGPAVLAVAPGEPGTGTHGLIGMRERVTGLGGELHRRTDRRRRLPHRRDATETGAGGMSEFPHRKAPERGAGGMSITVMIVDDQAMVREGFAALLNAQPDLRVVADAADGEQAVTVAGQHRPDVILMDIRMPGLDGIAATRRILAGPPGVPRPRVVILTTFDLDDYVFDALRAGASGFLLKDAPGADLVRAVRVVAAGESLLAPSVTRRLIEEFATRGGTRRPPAAVLNSLTAREVDVLRLIARGRSNTEIAADLVVAEQTVKTHITRIFAKLELRDRAQAVILAYETGLIAPGS